MKSKTLLLCTVSRAGWSWDVCSDAPNLQCCKFSALRKEGNGRFSELDYSRRLNKVAIIGYNYTKRAKKKTTQSHVDERNRIRLDALHSAFYINISHFSTCSPSIIGQQTLLSLFNSHSVNKQNFRQTMRDKHFHDDQEQCWWKEKLWKLTRLASLRLATTRAHWNHRIIIAKWFQIGS